LVSAGLVCFADVAFAVDITEVNESVSIADASTVQAVTVACPPGYTPEGLKISSDRVLAKFDGPPSGNQVKVSFVNWDNNRSGITQDYSLICIK
jgi:hypothetical protein